VADGKGKWGRKRKGRKGRGEGTGYVIKEGSQTDAVKGAHCSDLLHPKISNAERPDETPRRRIEIGFNISWAIGASSGLAVAYTSTEISRQILGLKSPRLYR
jgi:hypothetical protein